MSHTSRKGTIKKKILKGGIKGKRQSTGFCNGKQCLTNLLEFLKSVSNAM